MLRDVGLGQPVIGRLDRRDAGQRQFLRQAVLERTERPLRAAPSLRRIGRDVLDAELRQRPTELGRMRPGNLPAGLGRVEIVTASVGAEGAKQPVPPDHLAQAPQARSGAFLVHQEGRVDRACRIIERHHQIVLPARQPGMGRGVLVQHHPNHRPARPLLAMRPTLRRHPHQPGPPRMNLGHRVAELVIMPFHELLVKVLHREIRIAAPVQIQHPRDLRYARAPIGRSAEPTINQARRPFVPQPVTPPPKRPLADPQNLRRLNLV